MEITVGGEALRRFLNKKDIQTMLAIIRKALRNCHCTKAKSGGGPPKYPYEIIILAFLLKTHIKFTYRDLETYMSKVLPKGSVLDFSSIF